MVSSEYMFAPIQIYKKRKIIFWLPKKLSFFDKITLHDLLIDAGFSVFLITRNKIIKLKTFNEEFDLIIGFKIIDNLG